MFANDSQTCSVVKGSSSFELRQTELNPRCIFTALNDQTFGTSLVIAPEHLKPVLSN